MSQAGSSSDQVRYRSKNHVVTTGLNVRPTDRLDLALQLDWTRSDAGMEPFDLSAPEFTVRVPVMTYDFSQTWSYSDLDVSRLDGSLEARYRLNDRTWVRGSYRYVDYADDDPYLYDTSGRNHLFALSLGWTF